MGIAEELADKLAADAIAAAKELDDDSLIEDIARSVGASSPTTEELFRTYVRVRMAEERARGLLEAKLARGRAAKAANAAGNDPAA